MSYTPPKEGHTTEPQVYNGGFPGSVGVPGLQRYFLQRVVPVLVIAHACYVTREYEQAVATNESNEVRVSQFEEEVTPEILDIGIYLVWGLASDVLMQNGRANRSYRAC